MDDTAYVGMPLGLYGLETLLMAGLVLKAAGFLARDEVWLRALVFAGILFDAVYLALIVGPALPYGAALALLGALGLLVVLAFLRERTTFALPARQKRLYAAFRTLTPGQFRRINRIADYRQTVEETRIILEGEEVSKLFYIEGFRFLVVKGDQQAEAKGPGFAGEIAFLTGNAASASVVLPPGTPFVAWQTDDLKALMRRNAGLNNALIARFTRDLAGKVAQSIPMPRPAAAAPRPPVPPRPGRLN